MRAQLLARSLIAIAGLACASARVPARGSVAPASPTSPALPASPATNGPRAALDHFIQGLALWDPEREPLLDYLVRAREAEKRYGWGTDRCRAYVQLGDPDQVFFEPDVEIWVYTRYFGRLKFDHKRLTRESQAMLGTLVAQARFAR